MLVYLMFEDKIDHRSYTHNLSCFSCVYNCDDQSYAHIFLRSSNIWCFIYPLLLFNVCETTIMVKFLYGKYLVLDRVGVFGA